jgi:hypothetical protein
MPTPIETRGRTLAEDPSISLQLVGLEVKVKENGRICRVRVLVIPAAVDPNGNQQNRRNC